MNKIVPVVLLVAAAGAAAAWYWGVPQRYGYLLPAPPTQEIYGNVDIRQVSLGFRVGGRLAAVAVEEGDAVKTGDVLARLDAGPYEIAVRAAEENVAALGATLDKLKAGARPSEIEQARAAYEEQVASLANAEQALSRAGQLRSQGTVAQSNLDAATATRDMASARVASAKAALALIEEGSRAEDIAGAEAQLRAAEAQLDSARTSLADTELKAPADGVILSRVSEPGAIVASSTNVLVLALTEPVWVRAYVSEADLGRVHPGLKVKVTSDGTTGAGYQGQVGFISPVAEFTPKSVETPDLRTDLVYRLRIIVDHPGKDLRQGMPVTVHLPPSASEAR
ncbi:secretion protein HlyD [Pleomorphomonas carboxyditropha]|uniref:Secretion protein HlyD n=1 Tax=Pleomorphomonas carboxyditropha TaxID=2023338 RepID=A0A2G9X3I6_9HYPH|nr:secretion protein HlyD [Pleomorphomonas carboxyditropha]PIP01103.1 secretion protein HlyD [Pleomorphomonas carboxyditropha]